MSNGLSAYLSMFFGGTAGFSRLFVLLGLALAVGNGLRFLTSRPSAAIGAAGSPQPGQFFTVPAVLVRGGVPSLWWPFGLLWLGFWFGTGFRTTHWSLAVLVLVLVAVACGLHLLRAAHGRRGDEVVSGPALAVLLTTGVLVLFGLLLTVRLEVVRDPAVGFLGALAGDAPTAALTKVLLPAAVLAAALGLLALKVRPGRIRFERPRHDRWHAGGLVVVFLLFAAPLLGDGQLTLAGIATPEYGKIVYLAVLAMMLADHAYGFRIERDRLRNAKTDPKLAIKARRHLLYPFALFGVVGVASTLKSDIGPLIPVFAATVTMVWLVVRAEVSKSLYVSGQRGAKRSVAATQTAWTFVKPAVVPLLALAALGFLVMLSTSYITTRWETQRNPWVYNWAQSCVDAPEGAVAPAVPAGTAACRETLAGGFASTNSQIAQSLATIADGGMWGRGLADTTSRGLPAGSSDLVLAVIWSKLGGFVVLLLSALLALLASALAKLSRTTGKAASPERLFIGGFAGMVLVQFLFVLAATVNAVPHSGITAPFLSYGVQSTVALGLGVIIAVALHYRSEPRPQPQPRPKQALSLSLSPSLLAFLTCLMLAWGVTVWPYTGLAENRPFCATTSAVVDAERCSTDRIANARTSVELVVGGKVQYVRKGADPTWAPVGQPTVTLADLAGIVDGSALNDALSSGSGTSLGERVGPAAPATPGSVELSVDPVLQAAMATALRTPTQGVGPLAGGLVVLDARSGHVLTSASAPTETARATPGITVTQEMENFLAAHRTYYHPRSDGTPDETRPCDTAQPTAEERTNCVRWGLRTDPGPRSPEEQAGLRAYVGGLEGVTLPGPTVNRALGNRYGLGSTFKVVVAAAYLRQPGTTAQDLIPAPLFLQLGGQRINNYDKVACPGTTSDGQISLTQALAVSCNTAFVQLAGKIGWQSIEDTAKAFGFSLAGSEPGHAWLAGVVAGVDSVVPHGLAASDIGNPVLGGGAVEGTPLQMAAVMAAVANNGTTVQPSLVTSVTDPNGGEHRPVTGETREVLEPAQAEQLRLALSATATTGTAAELSTVDGRELWVKTGTHVLVEDDVATPAGQFVRQIAWLVGAMPTPKGPVSFAVAVETGDEKAGAARVRLLAQQAIDKVTEVRG
ncbi:Cell cycle protein [Lentzea waywayandensis]|uniref:Beta-lactamase n=1 Tax=Lentzea waywayandensis TaxID=84724 RepID=A0A1I6F4H6_9PSEU|nr:penicillin-binding transpeptidase domain-containing protein [Lentzea waywayandensis]SFR24794.1 Cell cycle protein [Lentzea waywayandensis]